MKNSTGKKIAILTENGFEEEELTVPKKALEEAGMMVYIVSPQKKRVKAWKHDHWSIELPVDVSLEEARHENYDALLLPGGVLNPDQLRTQSQAISFAKDFLDNNKTVAAICHGPQLLIETGKLTNVKMTSYPSIRTDLENAGAVWEDKEVVYDQNLITSRSPKDLPAFNTKIIEVLSQPAADEQEDNNGLQYKYSQSMS